MKRYSAAYVFMPTYILFQDDDIKRTSKISFRDTEEVQEYEKDLAIENDTKLKQHETHTKTASHLILNDGKRKSALEIIKSISNNIFQ